ncbi:MAG: SRPBCC family protein [Acidimicrobiia bacterium]|nr:SRPBCC family protein [Acidimicrobiia bacterium]
MATPADIVTVERLIPAPPEKIFSLIANPARHHELDGSGTVRDAKDVPEEPLQLGSKFGMEMKLGFAYSTENTVVEFEENRRIAWKTQPRGAIGRLPIGGRIWRYELEPTDGATLVRESWDISEERIKAVVRPAAKKTREAMEKTLARIEEIVTD